MYSQGCRDRVGSSGSLAERGCRQTGLYGRNPGIHVLYDPVQHRDCGDLCCWRDPDDQILPDQGLVAYCQVRGNDIDHTDRGGILVLAPVFGPMAWNLQNVLTHVVVPITAAIDFFVTGIYGNIGLRSVFLVTLPPLAYVIYAGIGYVAGWEFSKGTNYPYFFLNWGSPAGAFGFIDELPFMGCVWWIMLLLFALIVVGAAYLLILRLIRKFVKTGAGEE